MEIRDSIPIQQMPGDTRPPEQTAAEAPKTAEEAPESTGIIDRVEGKLKNIKDKICGAVKKSVDHALDKAGEGIGKVSDPALYEKKIEIPLQHDNYTNISLDEAAKMMGYFTQKMQNLGFPWSLYEIKEHRMKRRSKISELEALRRLQDGKEVLFQPMRNMQLDLSPESIGAAAKLGGEQLKPVGDVATLTSGTKVSAGGEGFEVRYGAPVIIKNFGELKFLYELYNPDAVSEKDKKEAEPSKIIVVGDYKPPEPKEDTFGKTAHNLSYYAQKTMGTAHPWRFIKEGDGTAIRMLKGLFNRGLPGALIGAGVGIAIGGPIGLFTGSWSTAITLASYGAMIGGGLMSFEGARDAIKGVDINAFETLSRVLEKKPVMLQERKKHSVNLPVLGNFSWYNDYGKGSVIRSPEELELFTKMQNQG